MDFVLQKSVMCSYVGCTYRNHSTANNNATAFTGMFMDVKIMMIVTILELGTDGIAMDATLVSNLQNSFHILYNSRG